MLKKIALVIVVVLAAVLGLAATKPASFTVVRETTIKAPPEKIFALVNDFHAWGQWSPWEKLDPAMKRTYDGPASGVGAIYTWAGDSKVGEGRMEILEASMPDKVRIKLDFLTPFESHNSCVFSITPGGDGTKVIWTMSGPNTFLSKIMTVFVSMDSMIGKDFESGLGTLKSVAEKQG